jgi:hypothetical protein
VKSMKVVAVAAVAIFALTACGGSSATPPGAGASAAPSNGGTTTTPSASTEPAAASATTAGGGPVDTCALLSEADLKTVTGKEYGAGVSDSVGGCSWNVGAAGVNQGALVYVAIQDQSLDFIKTSFPGGVDVTVSGHAGYWNPGQGLQSMWVDSDGRLLVLSFPRSEALGPEDQVIAQKLAEIAIAKM